MRKTFLDLSPQGAALFFGIVAAGALGLALLAQYGFGYRPCELCHWQRLPYGAVLLLAMAEGWWRKGWGVTLIGGALLAGAALASYHAAVEYGWLEGPGGCSGAFRPGMSLEEIQARLKGGASVRCDEPALVIFGLSMAGWNALFSFVFGGMALAWSARRRRTA